MCYLCFAVGCLKFAASGCICHVQFRIQKQVSVSLCLLNFNIGSLEHVLVPWTLKKQAVMMHPGSTLELKAGSPSLKWVN